MAAHEHLQGRQFFLYHSTPTANRDSIAQHGLRPQSQDEGGSGGVFFFSDRSRVQPGPHTDVWRAHRNDVPDLEHGSEWTREWSEDDPVWATGSPVPKVTRVEG